MSLCWHDALGCRTESGRGFGRLDKSLDDANMRIGGCVNRFENSLHQRVKRLKAHAEGSTTAWGGASESEKWFAWLSSCAVASLKEVWLKIRCERSCVQKNLQTLYTRESRSPKVMLRGLPQHEEEVTQRKKSLHDSLGVKSWTLKSCLKSRWKIW